MSRKVIDTYPVFTVTVGQRRHGPQIMTREQAVEAQAEFAELIDTLKAATFRSFDVESVLFEDIRCEHCNSTWTETSPDYNGGCCKRDQANDPESLDDLRKLAEHVADGGFYSIDEDGKRSRVPINWPDLMASSALRWLDAGRPAESVAVLLPVIRTVAASDWCTVWEDPGPSGCSLARLPDTTTIDPRPDQLAGDLLRLIDDMGLMPVRSAA